MSHDKVLSLLEAAAAALAEATHIMKDYSSLPLPPSPPSPISPSASMTEVDCEGYFFDESLYDDDKVHLKIWSVPGNDNIDGRIANVAINTNSYGISLKWQTDIAEQVLGPLGYCVVDKEKWDVVKEISVGDIFYMTNPTDGMVYRGIVTAQPVAGPFCPIRCMEKSFVACLGLVSDNDLRSEVEVVFKVDWKVYANYDEEWYEFFKVVGEGVCRLPDE
jgi:hypothetical protein